MAAMTEDDILDLSPEDARFVLLALVREKRLDPAEIGALAAGRAREIARLRQELARLEGGARENKPQRRPMSPETREVRQDQGRYMALLRQVPASQRAQYKELARTKGVRAALTALQSRK